MNGQPALVGKEEGTDSRKEDDEQMMGGGEVACKKVRYLDSFLELLMRGRGMVRTEDYKKKVISLSNDVDRAEQRERNRGRILI